MAKLDEKLIEQFAAEIEDGLPVHYTCDLLSITRQAYQVWIRQGESDVLAEKKTIEAQFFSAIKKSYARFIKTTKKKIHNGDPGWQGAAWWLERTNKDFRITDDDLSAQETVIVNPSIKPNKS